MIVIEDAALFDGLPVLVVLALLMAAELKGFNLRREHAAWVLDLVVRAAAACPHRDISGTQHKGWTSPKSQRRYRWCLAGVDFYCTNSDELLSAQCKVGVGQLCSLIGFGWFGWFGSTIPRLDFNF